MKIDIKSANPFVRVAEFQRAVLEGESLRMAYDNRLFSVMDSSGVFITSEREYRISKGSVIFIPPAVGYSFRGKMRVAVINFDMTRACDGQKKALCPPPVSHFDTALTFDKTAVYGFEQIIVTEGGGDIISDVTDIVAAFSRRDSYSDVLSSALVKLVLAKLLKTQDADSSNEMRLASKIDGYIRMYASVINGNDDIAREFGYHPVYLASVFKAHTGKTLHAAITDERLKTACRWLSQTNASIDDIAADTGFSSRSHFCTAFKAHFGISPGKWRSSQTKN